VTGDADGRVLVWDAKTMKESRRVEFGGRVMAVAISDDGTHTAAVVRGKQGGEFYVWETAKPPNVMKPIHTQQADIGFEPYAGLAFSRDGKHLAGCVIDRKWLQLFPKGLLSGQVHAWELAAEPKAQPAPRPAYSKPLSRDHSSGFVIVNNYTILTAATKEGAIDFRDIRNGDVQARLVLGEFAIGKMKLSSDRKWLILEQRPGANAKAETFDVGVYQWPRRPKLTIPSCGLMLDIASGGKVVAVVREKQVELWDTAAEKKLKAAPFKHTRIDAAQFSPDGKLLVVADGDELVLWRWEENKHERIDLGRRVGSLTFSPDGKFLADGPASGENVQVRDVETRKVVQALDNGTKRAMSVPRMAYTQGGRVLIACDDITFKKETAVPHRITIWDTANGSIAHQVALPSGLPYGIDVSPNGKYIAALIDDGESGRKLSVWRLDGEKPEAEAASQPPAADRPR
jgi:WD40 repeat protein